MSASLPRLLATAALLTLATSPPVFAQGGDIPNRVEQKRADLTGAPGMEVVSSIVTFAPGEFVAPHSHNGIESYYVIQGATIERAGMEATLLATGANTFQLRDVIHGGFKVIGPQALKLYTVHIVDKNKPLYVAPKPASP
jgi:quercetin dioxygenase-like cupin family protein